MSTSLQIEKIVEFQTENVYDEFFVTVLIGQLIQFNIHLIISILLNSVWKNSIENEFGIFIQEITSLEKIFELTSGYIEGYVDHTDIIFNYDEFGGNNHEIINEVILDDRFLVIATTDEQVELCKKFSIFKTNPRNDGVGYSSNVVIFQRPDLEVGLVDMAFAHRAKMVWNQYSFGTYEFLKAPFKVYGWAPYLGRIPLEGIIVREISQQGGYMYAADGHTNLAIYNEISDLGLNLIKPKPIHLKPNVTKLNNHLVSFIYSDGDNLNVMDWIMGRTIGNRTFPISWTINPITSKFILKRIYQTAPDIDSFIAGPSGIGYCYPDHMDEEKQNRYIKDTEKIMAEVGLTVLNQIGFSLGGAMSFFQERILNWAYWAPLPQTVLVPNVDAIISYDYFNYDLGYGKVYIEKGVPILTGTQKLYFPEDVDRLMFREFKKGEFTVIPVNLWDFSTNDLTVIADQLIERFPHIEFVNIQQLLNEFF